MLTHQDTWRLLVPGIVIIKNAVIQAMIVFLAGQGLIQIWLVIVVQVANIGLWTLVRPYKRWTENLHMTIVAVAKLCISVCLIIVNRMQEEIGFEDRETYFGWLLISLYSACIFSVLFSILAESIVHLWVWVSSRKGKSSQRLGGFNKIFNQTVPSRDNLSKVSPTSQIQATSTRELKSLQKMVPITSVKRGSVQSQQIIRVLRANPTVPKLIKVRRMSESAHQINRKIQLRSRSPEKQNSASSSRLDLNKCTQNEEICDSTNTKRTINDSKQSVASISVKRAFGARRHAVTGDNEKVTNLQQVPSFKRLPPLRISRQTEQQ